YLAASHPHNAPMKSRHRTFLYGLLIWLGLSLAGAIVLTRAELARQQEAFTVQSNIAYRLLGQRLAQHDAILQMLALLQPPVQRIERLGTLKAMFPQIMAIYREESDVAWANPQWQQAQLQSLKAERAVLTDVQLAQGRYGLLVAAHPASFAVMLDLNAAIAWDEWPFRRNGSPVRVVLEWQDQQWVISPGLDHAGPVVFQSGKTMTSTSQPFQLHTRRVVGYADLPWGQAALFALASALLVALVIYVRKQREQTLRAQELLRIGQVGRLNALGEMAAGLAHELNQPLTSVLANTQASLRLLQDDPPDLEPAREAMAHSVEQIKRAASVLTRLRHSLCESGLAEQCCPVSLTRVLGEAVHLLMPELERHGITLEKRLPSHDVVVVGEPVALGQIIHNLLNNAVSALGVAQISNPRIWLEVLQRQGRVELTVRDNGPGIVPQHLDRVFEPFFTTRSDGLGLGLSLSESLAQAMGGGLKAFNDPMGGAVFALELQLVDEEAS
ncbi:sensor histidine kinase, partial [Alcaligenes faecalis]|uniref:sensor histidine kinase n=1 Tax=Alcaligenes faecalis TaxID=511 RepID=UPI0018DF5DB2